MQKKVTYCFQVSDYASLPVIFWIYGGGLRNGAARFQDYRPDYWMDEDIILVTHNYRVGIFGFLSTGDEIIPGTYMELSCDQKL